MYLKFESRLHLSVIVERLVPETPVDSFRYDAENVYEWMDIQIPNVPCMLNVSREHGWAYVDDAVHDLDSEAGPDEVHSMVTPGPVYVSGFDEIREERVDALPDWLPQYLADYLSVDIFVFSGTRDCDSPEPKPIAVVYPQIP